MTKSIMIVGVGGQGSLLSSRIIGLAAIEAGYDAKISEVHGMSQRGGSVVTYVRYSDSKVYSPLISTGTADVVLAFELLEAYRTMPYLKKGAALITSTQRLNPMPVITGAASYPDGIEQKMKDAGVNLIAADALTLAIEAGNHRTANVVLIGILAKKSDIPKEIWLKTLNSLVPPRLLDVNIKAFEAGYALD